MPHPPLDRLRRHAASLAGHLRPRRRSVRLRLTVLYGTLFLLSSVAVLTITYLLVAHVPVTVVNHNAVGPGDVGTGRGPAELPSLAAQAGRHRSTALQDLLVRSGLVLAVTTVVSIGLGWLVAGRVLAPLRTITATTRRISASNLHHRLALPGPVDELKTLGDTIDALLARLENSFASQRQFIANASHELRTPLTLQRALLEAVLTDPDPSADSWRTTCERALVAGAQQERLIEALLTLAWGERGLDRRDPVDLAAITGHVLKARHEDATRRGIQLTTTLDPSPISGDPHLVERLVANLADNALRYNVATGGIQVWTGIRNGRVVLSMVNSGPLVSADDVDRLFQPFQRLASERNSHDGGLGLGLSIVEAIARAHDASVAARPQPAGGLEVEVRFPVAEEHNRR